MFSFVFVLQSATGAAPVLIMLLPENDAKDRVKNEHGSREHFGTVFIRQAETTARLWSGRKRYWKSEGEHAERMVAMITRGYDGATMDNTRRTQPDTPTPHTVFAGEASMREKKDGVVK